MLIVKCTDRIYDKSGRIIQYKLENKDDEVKLISSEKLKQAIKDGQVCVINLKLAKGDRLIHNENKNTVKVTAQMIRSIECDKKLRFEKISEYTDFEQFKLKMAMMGHVGLMDYDNILSYETKDEVIVVSSMNMMMDKNTDHDFFKWTEFTWIDMKNLSLGDLTNMNDMFCRCIAREIKLNTIDTSKITMMKGTFYGCQLDKLTLDNFDTTNVGSMEDVFCNCRIGELDISSFKYDNVLTVNRMFKEAKIKRLKIGKVVAPKLVYMKSMFQNANIGEVIIDKLYVPKVECAYHITRGFNGDKSFINKIGLADIERTAERNILEKKVKRKT